MTTALIDQGFQPARSVLGSSVTLAMTTLLKRTSNACQRRAVSVEAGARSTTDRRRHVKDDERRRVIEQHFDEHLRRTNDRFKHETTRQRCDCR